VAIAMRDVEETAEMAETSINCYLIIRRT
jgi:hypothetical protein